MEALARAVMTQIPANAIDRQAVCEVIGRAESCRRSGKGKEASRYLMQAGAALFKLQHEQAIAVAEQIFQQAVAMAKRGARREIDLRVSFASRSARGGRRVVARAAPRGVWVGLKSLSRGVEWATGDARWARMSLVGARNGARKGARW